ncbi:uncharacterized protein LOC128235272 isoform X2 [Mya arenaria]|uniref:uncharacterized protein LOC128235272 isoform X2 n=1 Tax=Mya arenaria TaxID=6604 RepID=UPI0022E03CA8|nr:uncharacterized protein LOC128235272 isoform X2 [Mya arenaria]XP_052806039.1 uncharacterized protein LOC128235272 isoform X2 [Mya arenaria]
MYDGEESCDAFNKKWKNISKEEKVHFKDKARKFAVERLAQQEKKAFNLSLAKQQQQHQQSWNEQQPRAPGHPPGPRTQPSINPVIEGSESAMTTEGYHGATSQQLFLNENNCGAAAISYLNFGAHNKSRLGPEDDSHCIHHQPGQLTKYGPNHSGQMTDDRTAADGGEIPTVDGLRTYPPYHPLMKHMLGNVGHSQGPSFPTTNHGVIDVRHPLPSSNHGLVNRRPSFPTSNNGLLDLRPSLSTMNNGLIDLRPAYPPSNYGLRHLTPSGPSTNRFLDLTPSMPTMNNGLIDLRPANPASNYGLLDLRPTFPSSNSGLLDLNPAFPLPHNGLDLGPSLPTSNSGLLDFRPSFPITNYGSIQPRPAYPTPTPRPQFDATPHVQQGGLNTSGLRQMQTGQNYPMPSLQPFPQEVYNNLQQARPVPVHSGHGGLVHHRMPFLSVSAIIENSLSYSKQKDDNPITPSLVVDKKPITQTKEQEGPNLDLQLHKHLLNSTCGNNLPMNLPKKDVETSLKQSESNQPQQIINIKDDEKYICICPQCGKKGFPSDGRFTCKSCNVVYMNMNCAYCSSGQFETPNALQEHLQICRGKFLAENRLIGHTNHDKQSYTDISFTKHPEKCNQESVTSAETEASLGKEKAKKLKQCFVQMKNVLQKHSSIVQKIYTSPEQNRMKSKALCDSTVIASSLENCANEENDHDVKGIDSERTMTGVKETQSLDSNDSMCSVSNSCEYSESEASDSSGYEEIDLDDDQATIDTVEIVKEYHEERFSEIPDKKSNISNASETANGTERPKGVITAREAKKLMSVGLNVKQPGKTIPSPKTPYEIRKEKMNSTKGNSISENSGKEDKGAKPRSCKNNSNSELNQTKIDDFSTSLNKKRTVAKTKILTKGKSKKETFYPGGNVSLEITTDPESEDEFHANTQSSQTVKKAIKEAHVSNHSETLSTDNFVSDDDSETESTDTYESEYESFTEIDFVSSANEKEKSSHATDKSKRKKSYKQPVHDKRKRKPTKQSRKRLRLERVAKRKAKVIAENTDTESSDENEIAHRSSRIKARMLGVTIADNLSSDESETVIVPRVTRSKDKTKVNEKQKNNRRLNTGKNVTLSKDSVIQNTLKRMLDEHNDESENMEKEDEDAVNEESSNVNEDDMSENDFNFMAYRTRKMAGLYSCKKCSKSFRTLYTLAKHMRTHSSASINESADLTGGNSDICVELVSTPNKVIRNTHGISSAQVEVTKEIPAPEHNVNVTDISKSSDGTVPMEFICGICGVKFETEVLLDIHWKMHTSSPLKGQFECGICKAVYHSSEHLERHVFTHNPATMGKPFSIFIQNSEVSTDEEFICGVCQCKFAVAEELHSHIISHSSTVFCQSCNQPFASLSELNNHYAQEHGPQIEHSCSTCSVAYKTDDELKVHMQDHTKLVASQRKVTSDVVVEKMQADSCSLELAGKAEIKTEGQKTNCDVHLTTTMNKLSAKLVDKKVAVMEPKGNDEDVKEQKEKDVKNPNDEELRVKEQKERKLKVKKLNEQREKELKKKELKVKELKEKELKKQKEKKSKVKELNEQNEKEKEQKKELEDKQNKVVEEAEKKKNISKLLSYKIKFF